MPTRHVLWAESANKCNSSSMIGNPSPVVQKGTRSKYRAATILRNPLLNKHYLLYLAESCPIAYWLLPRGGITSAYWPE